jgi:hypothetical protein
MSLSFLIHRHTIPPFELSGPDVALSRRYDVMAKAPAKTLVVDHADAVPVAN